MMSEIVGYTTSGKKIKFYIDLPGNELYIGWIRMVISFDELDLMEAYCVFEYLGHREVGKKSADKQKIITLAHSLNEIKQRYLGERFEELCKILKLEHFHDRLRKGR